MTVQTQEQSIAYYEAEKQRKLDASKEVGDLLEQRIADLEFLKNVFYPDVDFNALVETMPIRAAHAFIGFHFRNDPLRYEKVKLHLSGEPANVQETSTYAHAKELEEAERVEYLTYIKTTELKELIWYIKSIYNADVCSLYHHSLYILSTRIDFEEYKRFENALSKFEAKDCALGYKHFLRV